MYISHFVSKIIDIAMDSVKFYYNNEHSNLRYMRCDFAVQIANYLFLHLFLHIMHFFVFRLNIILL